MPVDSLASIRVYTRDEVLPTAEGPPWFVVHFLLDGRHRNVHKLLDSWLKILDAASARNILVLPIGNPRVQGELFRSLAAQELLVQAEEVGPTYQKWIEKAGGEDHYKEDEIARMARNLRIETQSLPCIVLSTTPILGPPEILRLNRSWLGSDESRYRLFVSGQ